MPSASPAAAAAAVAVDDPRAFDHLFHRYFDSLTRQVTRMVDCRFVAEELVQDVFLRMWRSRQELALRGNVVHYLRRAARNRALDWLRHEDLKDAYAQTAVHEAALEQAQWPASESDELAQLHYAMAACFAEMPERRREVCELRWRGELGPSAIAARLGISVKTVESHITWGTKTLRARMCAFLD